MRAGGGGGGTAVPASSARGPAADAAVADLDERDERSVKGKQSESAGRAGIRWACTPPWWALPGLIMPPSPCLNCQRNRTTLSKLVNRKQTKNHP